MITEEEYKEYFGVTAPKDLKRLEMLSLHTFKAIMVMNIPKKDSIHYEHFKNALMEQINFFNMNNDLINGSVSGGYTLGSYSEGSSNNSENISKSINRVSPVAYDILLSHGLLYSGLGGCNCG